MSFWAIAYKFGWASKAQLRQAVAENRGLTAADYKTITGEDYTATT